MSAKGAKGDNLKKKPESYVGPWPRKRHSHTCVTMSKRISPCELARLAVLAGGPRRIQTGAPMVWQNTFLRVYMEKLNKGWPANMAAVAGRRAQREEKKPPATVTVGDCARRA